MVHGEDMNIIITTIIIIIIIIIIQCAIRISMHQEGKDDLSLPRISPSTFLPSSLPVKSYFWLVGRNFLSPLSLAPSNLYPVVRIQSKPCPAAEPAKALST
jgi:hypothetical protein